MTTETFQARPTPAPASAGAPGVLAPSPLYNAAWMIRLIGSVTGEAEEVVLARMRREFWWPGSSVSEDFARRGLERYAWGEGLIRFYGETDAFMYELAVWNRNWLKRLLRGSVVAYVTRQSLRLGRPLRVLSIGDGLGFDCLELSRAGHDVTYYELPGRSETFARRLFAETGASVTVITDLGGAKDEGYDAVVCLDVLEHAPDPSTVVAEVVRRLRPGGLGLFSAPFFLILPWYPTHLKSNQRYSGSLALYDQHGLRLVDGSWTWAPLVLQKPDAAGRVYVNWFKVPIVVLLIGPLLFLGRWFSWLFLGCHVLRWMTNRWFVPPAPVQADPRRTQGTASWSS